jgi:hypothetical protein
VWLATELNEEPVLVVEPIGGAQVFSRGVILGCAMTTSPARRLIVTYAALLALLDLSVLLPGNPYSSVWGFIGAVGVQTLIVWRLWHGSSISWLFAMAFAAGNVLTISLMQPPVEVGVILMFVLSIAQAAILCLYLRARSRALSWPGGTPPEPLRQ